MIRLFIENNEVELTDDVQFAITKQFEDLSNPTTIINDWSKTVSIPFTQKNNELFGHIYNPDRLIIDKASINYISGSPSYIKEWNGSEYEDSSLVDGEIVCPLETEYLQIGFQYSNWTYSQTVDYTCVDDTHTYEFIYNPTNDYRFEFSFRNTESEAPNNEIYFAQWDLFDLGLVSGQSYVVTFSHRQSDSNYIIYNYSIRKSASNKEPLVGVYFNPLLKLNFRLEWNNTVLMIGYAKLNEIKQINGKGTYEITLFGQLGKVFQEMQKITFDNSVEDTTYLINGEDYVSEYINKDLVYDCWNTSEQSYSDVKKKTDADYQVTDIIGFAPNNSFSNNFDYSTLQTAAKTSESFEDLLGSGFTQDTGIAPNTVIPNGLLPREKGEYRSYLQLPFIYWNKLFQIFQKKAEDITGYEFELDKSWFNNANPYWYNLVYMLNSFSYSHETVETNKYKLAWRNDNTYWGSADYTQNRNASITTTYHRDSIFAPAIYDMDEAVPIYDTNTDTWSSDMYGVHINTTFNTNIKYLQFYKNGSYLETKLGTTNGLKLKFALVDSTTSNEITDYTVFICASNYNGTIPTVNAVINVDTVSTSTVISGNHYSSIPFTVPVYLYLPPNNTARLRVSGSWYNQYVPFVQEDGSSTSGTSPIYLPTIYLNNTASYKDFILTDEKRSYSKFTLNDLWNKDYNLFNEILKYCKMYRIVIYTDDYNKKIIFKPFVKYFENYTITDWTEKIDKSKDFIITPITFENKYVSFNYKDSETELGKGYKEKYGINYGDYKLTTDYNFNSNTNNLFQDITPSIVNTDNLLPWNTLINNRIIYSFPNEISVYNQDKDKKQVNLFGAWYFHNGKELFNTEEKLNLTLPYISDDSNLQQNTSTYFYTSLQDDMIASYYYTKLDTVRNDNICLFNIPKENYTYLNNYSNKSSIYNNLWENYINERYNIQNKKITCYVNIKPAEYNQFNWNKLVKVGNQLCVVNKIYDYDITSNQVTKVDLITIQDISGYNQSNYDYNYIICDNHELTIPYDYYKEVTIKANSDWEIRSDEWNDNLVAFPTSGNSGETKVIIGTINEEQGGKITFDLLNSGHTEVLGSDYVVVSVGGSGNMQVTPWYNECPVGSSITIQMNATASWTVYKFDKGGNENRKVLTFPSIASAGTINLTVSVPSDSETGIVDVYIKNMYSDLITSYRVNITN